MNEMLEQKNIWKGAEFWTKEIEKAGLLNNLRFFNDVITEKRPPHPDSGYGEPVLKINYFDIYTFNILIMKKLIFIIQTKITTTPSTDYSCI